MLKMSMTAAIKKATEDVTYYGSGQYGAREADGNIYTGSIQAGHDPRMTIRNLRVKKALSYLYDQDTAERYENTGALAYPGSVKDLVKEAIKTLGN